MADATIDPFRSAALAAQQLTRRLGTHPVAVVLGSGWSAATDALGECSDSIAGSELVGGPPTAVPGHDGSIRSVRVVDAQGTGHDVLVLCGRVHLYEGHDVAAVVHRIRAAVLSGCSTVVLTNAAGSLRPTTGVGSTVLIGDHLNLTGADPTAGPAAPTGTAPRFTDLSDLYSRRLRDRVRAARPELTEGVYAGLRGPSYETPAEIRMLATLGADLVGMSTVLEAIAARQLGAEVVGVSLVTNLAAGLQASIDHAEVLAAGHDSAGELVATLRAVLGAALDPTTP